MSGHRGVRVGAAAFALGLSLAGPQVVGVASADVDEADTGVVSAGSVNAATPAVGRSRSAGSSAAAVVSRRAGSGVVSGSAPAAASRSRAVERAGVVVAPRGVAAVRSRAVQVPAAVVAQPVTPAASMVVAGGSAVVASASASASASAASVGIAICCRSLPELANAVVVTVFDSINAVLNLFPANPVTDFLSGALLMVRRNWFDQAPVADLQQYKPLESGEIDGWVTGGDPEGDAISYSVTQGPVYGSVVVDPNTGSYVYTPGAGYDASVGDTFTVTESNTGVYNVLAGSTPATVVTVNLNEWGNILHTGDVLLPGQKLVFNSPERSLATIWELRMQSNGDLVEWVYGRDLSTVWTLFTGIEWRPYWSSATNGHEGEGAFAIIQSDGNFVVYKPDPSGTAQVPVNGQTITASALWSSRSNGWCATSAGCTPILVLDGNLEKGFVRIWPAEAFNNIDPYSADFQIRRNSWIVDQDSPGTDGPNPWTPDTR